MTEQPPQAATPVAGLLAAVRRLGRRVAPHVRGLDFAWNLFAAFFALHLWYRGRLWVDLWHARTTPFGIFPHEYRAVQYIGCSGRDAELGIVLALGALVALGLVGRWRWPARMVRTAAALLLWFAVAVAATHHRVMFDIGTGIDRDAIYEFFGPMPVAEVAGWGKWSDVVLALAPLPTLWLLGRLRGRWRRASQLILVTVALATMALRPTTVQPPSLARGVVRTPVHHVLVELGAYLRPHTSPFAATLVPDAAQQRSMRLVDPRLVAPAPDLAAEVTGLVAPAPALAAEVTGLVGPAGDPGERPLNVLVVVMESAGAEYVFDTSRGNPIPMPFLQKLARTGWQLKQHRSVANSSHRGLFSLFSGLYPRLDRRLFCLRADVSVPSLATFLGEGYDRFLMTPGRLETFFPRAFFARSGLSDLAGYSDLEMVGGGHQINARHEIGVVDRFLERLGKAKRPFFAVYYSFVPHFDYHDYGPETRILPDQGDILHRYFNNLRLLDTQIARIVARLEALGQADRTLLLLTGDHGEAFNQHPNNITHSRYSFEENLRVPAILVLPGRLQPREIAQPTSHVDLLPTVLDLVGVPYEPGLLQGESLLRGPPRRRYLFAAGNEDTYSAISVQGIKLQVSLRRDACWAFDLRADPQERTPLDCAAYPEQLEALQVMRGHQAQALRTYNAAAASGQAWHGLRHPPAGPSTR